MLRIGRCKKQNKIRESAKNDSTDEKLRILEIAKNKHDFEKNRRIGNAKYFVESNFLDENYPSFLEYVLSFITKWQDGDLQDFEKDLTPEEIKMINGREAYSRVILGEDDGKVQYAVVKESFVYNIIKTRGVPNRERVFKLLEIQPSTWQFNHASFKDEYIVSFERYINQVSEYLNSPNEVDFEVFRFHPSFFEFVCDYFDEVYEIWSGEEEGSKYLHLSEFGKDLMKLSDFVSKQLGEERGWGHNY